MLTIIFWGDDLEHIERVSRPLFSPVPTKVKYRQSYASHSHQISEMQCNKFILSCVKYCQLFDVVEMQRHYLVIQHH